MLEGGVEVWRGGVNAWQCDQMGHLNVRFYVAHAMEGLVALGGALGMSQAFAPRGSATLQVLQHHIRFLKEARVGDPLNMTAGLLGMGEDDARVLMLLAHSGEESPAAIVQTLVSHVSAAEGRARLESVHGAIRPGHARPWARGIAVLRRRRRVRHGSG